MDDASKMEKMILEIEEIKNKHSFKSAKNNKIKKNVHVLLDKVVSYINEKK